MKMPTLIPLAWALAAGTAAAAGNCEVLRAQIEAKISAAGVTRFSVVTLDAAAPADGQVVGSCDLGSRKIVYQREGGGLASSAARPAPARGEPILTECKDGTVSMGGDCRK